MLGDMHNVRDWTLTIIKFQTVASAGAFDAFVFLRAWYYSSTVRSAFVLVLGASAGSVLRDASLRMRDGTK